VGKKWYVYALSAMGEVRCFVGGWGMGFY